MGKWGRKGNIQIRELTESCGAKITMGIPGGLGFFVPKVGHGEINPGGFLGNVRNQLDSCFGIGLFNKV